MSQKAALDFVGRVVADKAFSDELQLALRSMSDTAQRRDRLTRFAGEHGYEVTAEEIAPYVPRADGQLADEELERVAGGLGLNTLGASGQQLSRLLRSTVHCVDPPTVRGRSADCL